MPAATLLAGNLLFVNSICLSERKNAANFAGCVQQKRVCALHASNQSRQLEVVARGVSWSPGTHKDWPRAFKAAARCLLLLSARRSPSCSGAGLAVLPLDALLAVLRQAALPMSAWL